MCPATLDWAVTTVTNGSTTKKYATMSVIITTARAVSARRPLTNNPTKAPAPMSTRKPRSAPPNEYQPASIWRKIPSTGNTSRIPKK